MHKAKLAAHSDVFEAMFEIGEKGGEAKVEMQESAKILEVILPYIYPHRVINFDLQHPQIYLIIRALDKYQVRCSRFIFSNRFLRFAHSDLERTRICLSSDSVRPPTEQTRNRLTIS